MLGIIDTDRSEEEKLILDVIAASRRLTYYLEDAGGTIDDDSSIAVRQRHNAQREEEEMAEATRASIEASYNELAQAAHQARRKRDLEEVERRHEEQQPAVKQKKKRGRSKADPCVICQETLGFDRRKLGVFPNCGHSQFHVHCAKASYEATNRCPLCNLDQGVPFALR